MHNRSKLGQIYCNSIQMIFTQFSKTIKLFRIDNVMNIKTLNSLISFTHKASLFSVHVQEHLSKMVGLNLNTTTYLTLLGLFSFPPHVLNVSGVETALIAVYTISRFPSSILHNQSPFECLYGTPPSYSSLGVFGCVCFVLLQPHKHSKL